MKFAINGNFWNRPTTGSGQYVRALLAELARRDPANEYSVIEPSAVSNLPSVFGENLSKVWFEQIAFGRTCIREHAALAHVPYFGPPLFSRTPLVVTIHDLIPLVLPLYRGSPLVRAYTQLAALGAKRADAIIADSECSKRDIVMRLKIDPAHVHVVYLAADARFRPVEPTQAKAIRRKHNLPDRFLLYLGGYDQRKNVRVIIQAFARLPELYRTGIRLVLAGVKLGADSEFFPDPRRIAHEAQLPADAVCFIGWVDEADKPALYTSATAFLFPSLYEGFGLPPLEAMACGTPVIVSKTSSLPEIAGDAAIQVNANDIAGWADAMRTIVSDESRCAEMRERGLTQAQRFSWTHCADETLAVYRAVIHK
jgi:glycosyltransferase involved in cell wall biosynthesis